MDFNEEKVKNAGSAIFSRIKKLKEILTNLDDSGGKIIRLAQWCLNFNFYLMLVLSVVWMFVGIRFSMVYHWGGYYSAGYYSFSLLRYLGGFLAIIVGYAILYMSCLWMKSYGELVNNTKVLADDCRTDDVTMTESQQVETKNEVQAESDELIVEEQTESNEIVIEELIQTLEETL